MANYYPPVSFSFKVAIAGNQAEVDASFQEVSGLSAEVLLNELKEGGENRFVHQLPGQIRYQPLVLKRGLMLASSPLYDWCKSTLEFDFQDRIQPKDLQVQLLDENLRPLMSWSVVRAWPTKWTVADFKAEENAVAVETIELSFQRLSRKVVKPLRATGFL